MYRNQGRESNQAQESGINSDAPKKKCFYALKSRGNEEVSPDVVTGMLQVFSVNVYEFLDPSDILYFVILLLVMKIDVLPNVLVETYFVSTLVGHSIVVKRVYMSCPYYCPIELHWLIW